MELDSFSACFLMQIGQSAEVERVHCMCSNSARTFIVQVGSGELEAIVSGWHFPNLTYCFDLGIEASA
jgi:hypothetical protein